MDKSSYKNRKLILNFLGIIILFLGWVLDSIFHAIFEDKSFIDSLIHPDTHELWPRINIVVIYLILLWVFNIFSAKNRKANDALLENEKTLRNYIENAPHGVFVADEKGNYVDVNPAACKITGYTNEELLRMNLKELIAEESLVNFAAQLKKVVKEGNSSGELAFVRKDSTKRFWTADVVKLSELRYLGFVVDITERKQAEEEILRLYKAVENSPVSIVMTDINGIIDYVNPKFCELTQYSKEEAIGKNPRILNSGKMPKGYYKNLWDTILSRNEWHGELINKKKNGELYWESASISPVFDVNGTITHIIAIKEDITERKQTEHELQKLYEDIKMSDEMIQESLYEKNMLVEELSLSEEKLRETIETRDRFFSIISHDLRSPFSGFLGLTEIMSEQAEELPIEDIIKMSKAMNKSANSVYTLIEELLQWSRTQTGDMPFNCEEVDLYELACDNTDFLMQIATNKNIKLIQNIEPNTFISCDRNMITTVIRNLLSNAIKFTNTNGVISIYLAENDKNLTISVQDTGVGMSKEIVEKLFRIDTKVTSVGTNNEKGIGLGLILCKEFVEKHGGKIWVESEVGKGSTFCFTLSKSE